MNESIGIENIKDFITETERTLRSGPPIEKLREIREFLDNYAVLQAIKKFLRETNNPDSIADFHDTLVKLQRNLEEKEESLKDSRDQIRIWGIGGGATIVTGSIVAIPSLAIGGLALIPIAGGIAIAARSSFASRKITKELKVIEQIKDRIQEFVVECRNGD